MTSNGTLQHVDGREVLRFERTLAHPIEKVWQALTDPRQLADWLTGPTGQVETDHSVGGPIRFAFDEEGDEHVGVVTAYEPPAVFAYTWDDDQIRWELRHEGAGCRLVLTHAFVAPADPATLAAGWHTHLEQLDALLDGAPIPWPADRWIELKQAYVAAFPSPGRVSVVDGRPRVRFSRLLDHPPEKVFRALTDHDQLRQWFPVEIRGELRAGARVTFVASGISDGFPDSEGAVLVYDPPKAFAYTWGGETLRFEIWSFGGAFGGRCRLVFTHEFGEPVELPDELFTQSTAGWHAGLDLLEGVLAGRPVQRSPEQEAELIREYAEGSSASPSRRGRSLLRLERRLAAAPDRVWQALTDSDQIRQWLDPAETTLGEGVGAEFEIVYRGYGESLPARILEREPSRVLAYTWGDDVVRWELSPSGAGSRLVFTNDLHYEADVGCVLGWSTHHDGLEELLAGGDPHARPAKPFGSLATLDGVPVFCLERWLAHPPEKVWRAITEPTHLMHWFPSAVAVDGELVEGAELRFTFEGGEGAATTGKVLEAERPSVFAYTWGDNILRFEIEPEGSGSRLALANLLDDDREQNMKNAAGWHGCIDQLEAHLDEAPAPDPASWKQRYIRYNARLPG